MGADGSLTPGSIVGHLDRRRLLTHRPYAAAFNQLVMASRMTSNEWAVVISRYRTIIDSDEYRMAVPDVMEACRSRHSPFAMGLVMRRAWDVAAAIELHIAQQDRDYHPGEAGRVLTVAVLARWVADDLSPHAFAALTWPFSLYLGRRAVGASMEGQAGLGGARDGQPAAIDGDHGLHGLGPCQPDDAC